MTNLLTIFGTSTATTGHNEPDASDAAFTWLHLEGASYLRMHNAESTDAADIVVTVVGIADHSNAASDWLLLV